MSNRGPLLRTALISGLAAAGLALGGAASAHDHLVNGATRNGADNRGFANPVAGNPSGTSGGASQPGTVPGLGDPNSGGATGTPAFDCETLELRLAARSSGQGPDCD